MKKREKNPLRTAINRQGVTLIAYYGIMNLCVTVALLFDLAFYVGSHSISDPSFLDGLMTYLTDSLMRNGWGYLLAIVAGVGILALWKDRGYTFRDLFAKNRTMTVGTFFSLLAVFLCAQLFCQLFSVALELLLNAMGLSAMAALEAASITATGVSMFLYASILGPVAEELLFRGVLLRQLAPWGKQTAIVISAVLFGVFHGNIIQIPFAFLVGLVLGYVTMEYSVIWAILLHIINNMVLGDFFTRLTANLPEEVSGGILYGILAVAAVAAVILMICNRKTLRAYFAENRLFPNTWRSFFTAPATVIFSALMLLLSLFSIQRL